METRSVSEGLETNAETSLHPAGAEVVIRCFVRHGEGNPKRQRGTGDECGNIPRSRFGLPRDVNYESKSKYYYLVGTVLPLRPYRIRGKAAIGWNGTFPQYHLHSRG